MNQPKQYSPGLYCVQLAAVFLCVISILTVPEPAFGQQGGLRLEEVVVTAQRREESLQEVPVSVSVVSGLEIDRQGYRNLEDMGKFTPSVTIMDGVSDQITTIRGFGTAGNSQGLQAAAPLFVDGIHYGSLSMVKNAFLDTERVEVLKGPQPLHFGMNATAGAFNIQSRRPTAEWEGDFSAELASYGKREVTLAFGGPLSDTLGIRIAGTSEKFDGPIKDYTDGHRFPGYENLGGRVSLEWTPNDQLNVWGKFDYSRLRQGGEMIVGCLTEGDLRGFPNTSIIDGGLDENADIGNPLALNADFPKGVSGGSQNLINPDGALPRMASGKECFEDGYGWDRDGPYIAPPPNIVGEQAELLSHGAIDFRDVANRYLSVDGADGPGVGGFDVGGIQGEEAIDSWSAVLDVNYELANGINISSQTGYIHFLRNSSRNNTATPLLNNFQARETDKYQYSQQIRVESPLEGYEIGAGVNMEFLFGAFYQRSEADFFTGTHQGNLHRPQRMNKLWEDANWLSGFWNLTFNLMDNQLSISAGGRYTDIHKNGFVRGWGAQLVFDEFPCDSDGTDADPTTCTQDPDFKMVHPDLNTVTFIDPVTGNGGLGAGINANGGDLVRVDSPRFLADGADLDNLWAPSYFLTGGGNITDEAVPLNWRSPDGPQAVGWTAPVYSNRNGPHGDCAQCVGSMVQDANDYNTQVTISYTPNALQGNHTFYGKYADAFKGPFADTGQTSLPGNPADLIFDPEYVEGWEVGAKGLLLDGRVRYDVALFTNQFTDLQTSIAAPVFNPGEDINFALNAGKQKVDGIEFSIQAAATEHLTVNFGGALMDAVMQELDGGGCTEDELIAASIRAEANPGDYSADELDNAAGVLDVLGPTRRALLPSSSELPEEFFFNGGCRLEDTPEFAAGETTVGESDTIDRSGVQPAFTPDWKFVLGLTYIRPVLDNYEIMFNAQGLLEDEMTLDPEGYRHAVMYKSGHGDLNLSLGLGAQDGSWRITGFVRNLFEDKVSFLPEHELELMGLFTTSARTGGVDGAVNESGFRSYGLRFEYFYQ